MFKKIFNYFRKKNPFDFPDEIPLEALYSIERALDFAESRPKSPRIDEYEEARLMADITRKAVGYLRQRINSPEVQRALKDIERRKMLATAEAHTNEKESQLISEFDDLDKKLKRSLGISTPQSLEERLKIASESAKEEVNPHNYREIIMFLGGGTHAYDIRQIAKRAWEIEHKR